jgi:predicted nucleic-acid-binding protein
VIALDTNILVRLVLHDDETQARLAERLLIKARNADESLFVPDVVLCELVWVLTRRVGLSRADIADTIDRIFRTELIVLSDAAVLDRALGAYRHGKGDFADYLIREQAIAAGASEVATFDRVLKGEEGFRLIAK